MTQENNYYLLLGMLCMTEIARLQIKTIRVLYDSREQAFTKDHY